MSRTLFILLLLGLTELMGFSKNYDYIVARDGSGDFSKIQDVIDAIPHLRKGRTTVFIKNGIYKEKIIIPTTKVNISFIGEDVNETIITYDDYASKENKFGETLGTSGSSSIYIYGSGFEAENITFSNTSGEIGQAVAVRVDGDQVVFRNCKFLGYQDTLYPHGEVSRQYYKNCYIEGTVDFIFGWSTAVFDSCHIHCIRGGGGFITAASTLEETKYGFVFRNCKLTGVGTEANYYLGRPWRPHAKTVFLNCNLGSHIRPEGWHNWNKPDAEKSSFYAEYGNTGPGSDISKRVKWMHHLDKKQADLYTLENIFDGWNPNK